MEKLLDGGHFFEGPRWHDGAWYTSDLYSHQVLRVGTDGTASEVVQVPNQPSGIGWLPDGTLLVVSMKDSKVLRLGADGTVVAHGDLAPDTVGYANDMVVDQQGRAFVGTFGFDLFGGGQPRPGAVSRVDPDGTTTVVAEDLYFPNGMIVTPEGDTLLVAETFGARFTAFSIAEDGSLHNRRVWGQVGMAPSYESLETIVQTDFAPDGCVLDAEGHIWVADALNGRAVRVAPGGPIVDEVKAPDGLGLYSVTLGGPDGRTLLACTAPSFAEHERKAAKESALYVHTVEVPRAEGRP